jgi:uncharacterized protein (TIGR03435 family)
MMSFAAIVIVKATLVCGAAFLLGRMCRRARASIRHLLFALAFAALIAIPPAGRVVPPVTVTLPAAAAFREAASTEGDVAVQSSVDPDPARHVSPAIAETSGAEWQPTIPQVLVVLWLIGLAVFLLPVLAGFWQVRHLRRTAIPWAGGQDLLTSLASVRGVRRRIDGVLHEAVGGPLTCGVLRPSIILPLISRDWDETSLRRALRHELEHVARWDLLTICLSRTICAAYWFHPLVWAAWRRLRLEAEKACDDAVVFEDDARDYALLLVAMAQPAAGARPPFVAMAGRDDLAVRVAALLDERQTRGRIGPRRAAALTVAGVIAMFTVASITVGSAMPQAQVTPASSAAASAAASIKRNPPTGIRDVGGRTIATGMTVRALLIAAFAVRDVENVPYWVRADRFDIVFDASYKFGPLQESKAMQAFLTERFKLVAHRASKDFPVYALVQAQPNRRGAQLTPSQLDCSNRAADCGLSSRDGQLIARGITMAELVRYLPPHLGSVPGGRQLFDRELMDRTGLSGRFDFRLEWAPDTPILTTPPTPGASQQPFVSVLGANAPNFLRALEEQLGLTIESQLAPAPVLVIDSIEPPTEN